jgi:hypothetical protein
MIGWISGAKVGAIDRNRPPLPAAKIALRELSILDAQYGVRLTFCASCALKAPWKIYE